MEAASINLFLVPLDRSLIFLSAGTFNRDRYSLYSPLSRSLYMDLNILSISLPVKQR